MSHAPTLRLALTVDSNRPAERPLSPTAGPDSTLLLNGHQQALSALQQEPNPWRLSRKSFCARSGISRATAKAMSDLDEQKAEDDPRSSTTLLGDFL